MHRIAPRIAAFAALVLAACSNPPPPTGRWEGVYEDPGLIVAVRLEIDSADHVRVSAPNAVSGEQPLSQSDRAEIRGQLLEGLARSWPSVSPLPLEFDGKVFHKPGGVAPQLEWDAKSKRMTMIYYSGNRASVRVPLSAVAEFGAQS
jgi:hypothetical protein